MITIGIMGLVSVLTLTTIFAIWIDGMLAGALVKGGK